MQPQELFCLRIIFTAVNCYHHKFLFQCSSVPNIHNLVTKIRNQKASALPVAIHLLLIMALDSGKKEVTYNGRKTLILR